MNNNNILWIVGVIVVVVIVSVLLFRSPATSLTPATGVTETNEAQNAVTGGGKPIVTAIPFASVSSTTAVVVGTITTRGAQTTYWFEYGPTASYGFYANKATVDASHNPIGVAAYITGLKPNTQYYFRLGAKNINGIVYDGPYSFITATK